MATTVSNAPLRIEQIDLLRGFALVGIFWVNIVVFGLPQGAYAYPTLFGTADKLNLWIWASSEVFVEGTMRGLFSMLFGASALIFLDEVRLSSGGVTAVERFYRRNLLLMGFGIIHAYLLLWPYDVLYAYGLLGLFLFPLRRLRARWLIAAGLALLLLGEVTLGTGEGPPPYEMSTETAKSANSADVRPAEELSDTEKMLKEARESMDKDIETVRAGYWAVFVDRLVITADQQSTWMYRNHVFDIGGMMLIGMALFKLGVLTGTCSSAVYLLLILAGYGSAVLLRGEGVYTALTDGFDAQLLRDIGDLNHDLGRLPGILGHIGMILLLARLALFVPLARALARVGRMALTNYIAQTIVSLILFIGFGLYGTLERYQLALLCVAIWVLQIAFSYVWLAFYRLGPLEWVWRSLIYGAGQPMRSIGSNGENKMR
jgi:uncharacterized protein